MASTSASPELDMSSFPLLPLHEVPLHQSSTLASALSSLDDMLASSSPSSASPLEKFAKRLRDAIDKELSSRVARDRVKRMLDGDSAAPPPDVRPPASPTLLPSPPPAGAAALSAAAQQPQSDARANALSPRPSTFRVPLPSELRRQQAAASSSSAAVPEPSQPSTSSQQRLSSQFQSSSSSSSRPDVVEDDDDDDDDDDRCKDPSSIPIRSRSASTITRQQALSGSTPPKEPTSQYSLQALNAEAQKRRSTVSASFGSVAIVLNPNSTGGLAGRARLASKALKARRLASASGSEPSERRTAALRAARRSAALRRLRELRERAAAFELEKSKADARKKRRAEREAKAKETQLEAVKAGERAAEQARKKGLVGVEVSLAGAAAAAQVLENVQTKPGGGDDDDGGDSDDSGESLSEGEEADEPVEGGKVDIFKGIEVEAKRAETPPSVTEPPPAVITRKVPTPRQESPRDETIYDSYVRVSSTRDLAELEKPAARPSGGFFAPPPAKEVITTTTVRVTTKTTRGGREDEGAPAKREEKVEVVSVERRDVEQESDEIEAEKDTAAEEARGGESDVAEDEAERDDASDDDERIISVPQNSTSSTDKAKRDAASRSEVPQAKIQPSRPKEAVAEPAARRRSEPNADAVRDPVPSLAAKSRGTADSEKKGKEPRSGVPLEAKSVAAVESKQKSAPSATERSKSDAVVPTATSAHNEVASAEPSVPAARKSSDPQVSSQVAVQRSVDGNHSRSPAASGAEESDSSETESEPSGAVAHSTESQVSKIRPSSSSVSSSSSEGEGRKQQSKARRPLLSKQLQNTTAAASTDKNHALTPATTSTSELTPAIISLPPKIPAALAARIRSCENRGNALLDAGDKISAEKEFRRILQLDPNNASAIRILKESCGVDVLMDENVQVKPESDLPAAAAPARVTAAVTKKEGQSTASSPAVERPEASQSSDEAETSDGNEAYEGDDSDEEDDENDGAQVEMLVPQSAAGVLVPPLSKNPPTKSEFSVKSNRLEAARERVKEGWTPRHEALAATIASSPAVSVSNPSATPLPSTEPKRARFTDIYPTISHIFSAYYERDNVLSNSKNSFGPASTGGNRKQTLSTGELATCLHFQWWLYSVFSQVMDDYATVFSAPESRRRTTEKKVGNNGNNGGVDGDDDGGGDDDDDDALEWAPQLTEEALMARKKSGQSQMYNGSSEGLHFRVNSTRSEVYNIVSDCLNTSKQQPLWVELPIGLGLRTSWNLLWTWSKPKVEFVNLLVFQKVNHFRQAKALTRKDLLKKHIQRFCGAVGGTNVLSSYLRKGSIYEDPQEKVKSSDAPTTAKETASNFFDIMQQTFVLPQEFNSFVAAFSTIQQDPLRRDQNFWIMKPVGLSRGRGISVINDIGSVNYSEQIVVQKYLMNPLLLDGYKFDLRIYVLVTSFSPLEAFIYKQGFARMSSEKFSTKPEQMKNKMVHLTNSSIQKYSTEGFKGDNAAKSSGEDGGSKISLNHLWKRLAEKGIDTDSLWKSVCEICLKTLVCVDDSIPFQPNAFEVYGFDIIFDDAMKPWVIEVNSSPSMARETKLDEQVKEPMIHDSIRLVEPPVFDRSKLVEVCERRMREMQSKASHREKSKKGTPALSEGEQLELDLEAILKNKVPRQYGVMPEHMGHYQRLAPGEKVYDVCMKMKGKLFRTPAKAPS